MGRDPKDPQEYVLVYDGESGLRMAPAGARDDDLPEPRMGLGSGLGLGSPDLDLDPIALDPLTPVPRRSGRAMVLVGSVGACVLALGLGLGLASRQAPPSEGPTGSGLRMKVVVAPERLPPPPAAVGPSERLEVLSPATLAVTAPAPRPAPLAASPPQVPQLAVAPPIPIETPWFREAASDPPGRGLGRAATDCRVPGSRAENMVCADPELLAADRRMARAFRAVARSGVDARQLRDEQDDWLDIREDAAGRSPRAVAQIYDQRIEELEAMAAEASPDR
jgi:hypothetical protein